MKKVFLLLYLFCTLSIVSYAATLNLKIWIEFYYCGGGCMSSPLQCIACPNCGSPVDTILVQFHDTVVTSTIVFSHKGLLLSDGTFTCTFPDSLIGKSYYIGVKHRNALETWSAPYVMSATSTIDFTTAASDACGSNMIFLENFNSADQYGFYQGDVNQDGKIDQLDSAVIVGAMGSTGYVTADINGDCIVDSIDIYLVTHSYYTPVSCAHFPLFISSNVKPALNFSLSPNPATKNIVVSFSRPLASAGTLVITNVLGQNASPLIPLSKGEGKKEVDISGLARGVYFVTLQTEEGRVAGRFVKE